MHPVVHVCASRLPQNFHLVLMAKQAAKVCKDEKRRLKEERKSFDINAEYPQWEGVDYDLQIEEFLGLFAIFVTRV